ncbi:hypothetical protein CSB45_06680 [candidate division KSB3 bacterium]|uniref:Uncharacterized protein n=1 Tax=candidate division KSB3 bacterium TaxID=2044937 RepID=A0A2G6E6V7_9BACT|nr:MAG: hypothetical protein CSB45_06680 [candidate division KSB3 bacterium]PIE30080.1 MAG: hypothetical protein CSA57_05915 [candidate division KSB3 bacterium]
MSTELIQELQHRMKELEGMKADLWEKGEYDPMMEGEYWDCRIVMKQMQEGDDTDVSELQKKKHDGMVAAQQQIHKVAEQQE